MNEFEYTLIANKIDSFTTIKAHEEMARELNTKIVGKHSSYFYSDSRVSLTTYENLYKAQSKVIAGYTGKKGLPEFITHNKLRLQAYILNEYLTKQTPTYERYIDVFQFEDSIDFERIQHDKFKKLVEMVGSNTPKFEQEFYFINSGMYTSISSECSQPSTLNKCLEIESIKDKLPQDKVFTVIENALDKYYSDLNSKTTMVELIPAIDLLSKVAAIAAKRIDG